MMCSENPDRPVELIKKYELDGESIYRKVKAFVEE